MKQTYTCGYCGAVIGTGHKWEEKKLLFFHFKEYHPSELKEMNELYKKLQELKNKYQYSGWLGTPL